MKSYIEQLIDLQLVKPGDRVFAIMPEGASDVAKRHWPVGWGTVVDTHYREAGTLFVKIDFDKIPDATDRTMLPWRTRAARITEWIPAKERVE
jgi:hypothetical protein